MGRLDGGCDDGGAAAAVMCSDDAGRRRLGRQKGELLVVGIADVVGVDVGLGSVAGSSS